MDDPRDEYEEERSLVQTATVHITLPQPGAHLMESHILKVLRAQSSSLSASQPLRLF